MIGYTGELYHAWISVYIKDVGWIDNIIYFDGKEWSRMDPTLCGRGDSAKEFVGMAATITIFAFIDLGENRMAKKQKRLSDSEIAGFCEQLAYIIKAGISLQEGLMLMSEDAKMMRRQK